MATILDQIVADKLQEVSLMKQSTPVNQLKDAENFSRVPFSLKNSLKDPFKTGIIAEFKKQSPSKGIINNHSTVEEVTIQYCEYGASCISVLTDQKYFGGSKQDLRRTRALNDIPVLRKDFIVDSYQIYEAKAMGADVILLIASCLTKDQISEYTSLVFELGMEVLFEVHSMEELKKLNSQIEIVGINNRDLKTFVVDIENSKNIYSALPAHTLKIAESGIGSVETAKSLLDFGFDGLLMGENFMKEANPGLAFKQFAESLRNK